MPRLFITRNRQTSPTRPLINQKTCKPVLGTYIHKTLWNLKHSEEFEFLSDFTFNLRSHIIFSQFLQNTDIVNTYRTVDNGFPEIFHSRKRKCLYIKLCLIFRSSYYNSNNISRRSHSCWRLSPWNLNDFNRLVSTDKRTYR